MKPTISVYGGHGIHITTSNGYVISLGIGSGHYCDNHSVNIGEKNDPTSNMEVAIMKKDGRFVCLPHDVAGYVPVFNLSYLLQAVEAENWVRVCDLCDQDASDHENKFPLKEEKNV